MNTNQIIYKSSSKINLCPLCSNKKATYFGQSYWNRYTDEFSNLIKVPQVDVMRSFVNKKCSFCGLIYKNRWFKKKILRKVYTEKVPVHPSGWDLVSNKFTKKNLTLLIKKFIYYSQNVNEIWEDKLGYGIKKRRDDFNILVRTIKSIIKSIKIKTKKQKILQKRIINAIDKRDLFSINKHHKKIITLINDPKDFSRFTGFNNENLFNFIEKKIGKIDNYAEIGCPLWGMINLAQNKGCKTFFIKPEESYFWGKKCKKNGVSCANKISNKTQFINFYSKKKIDYMGIYALLDHYDNLKHIIEKTFSMSKTMGIITEVDTQGIPIQHCTGLSNESLNFIAKKYNKKLNSSFKNIKESQYRFHLFY